MTDREFQKKIFLTYLTDFSEQMLQEIPLNVEVVLDSAIVKKSYLTTVGNIWAKSTPGTGTSIYFTLKVKDDTR